MSEYIPELGQICFGQPHQSYKCSGLLLAALSAISDEWDRIMWNIHQKELENPFGNTGARWKCDEFEVNAYDWNEDNEQPYNFKWKDIEISWYKYLGRGMSCNMQLSPNDISSLLDACMSALRKHEIANSDY